MLAYWEIGVYLNSYPSQKLSKLVKMWKKLDISENLSDGEQKSFSETKKTC